MFSMLCARTCVGPIAVAQADLVERLSDEMERPDGGTDIMAAVQAGLELLAQGRASESAGDGG